MTNFMDFTARLDEFLASLGRGRPAAKPGPRNTGGSCQCWHYFAYGSNMNAGRARRRIPGAPFVGKAVLRNYAVRERLYADIVFSPGATVEGVLFRVRPWHVIRLDIFEGAPRTYLRKMVPVTCDGRRLWCWTYMMTEATRATREGLAYPPWYRSMCSEGARQHGVRDDFAGGRGI